MLDAYSAPDAPALPPFSATAIDRPGARSRSRTFAQSRQCAKAALTGFVRPEGVKRHLPSPSPASVIDGTCPVSGCPGFTHIRFRYAFGRAGFEPATFRL